MSQVSQTFSIRPGFPDFLDLPWEQPLENWDAEQVALETVPIGICRHPVVFVRSADQLYALKHLPGTLASQEYHLLRKLEEFSLPAVTPVGYVTLKQGVEPSGVLITRYLSDSVPYRLLFVRPDFAHYREHLLDAMASLLVQLHLNGIFWGDCSLSNTLFRRDAGRLQAYLVDAETSEWHPQLADNLRAYELDIMNENVAGALSDLAAAGDLPANFPILEIGESIQQRYTQLWHEVTHSEKISRDQTYLIRERIQNLNQLGFSVDEVLIQPVDGNSRLQFRVLVADRYFHKNTLANLTGLEAEEHQAQRIMNEIQAFRAQLGKQKNRSIALSQAAQRWFKTAYEPTLARLQSLEKVELNPIEFYCLLQDHKWYLSEKAQQDVGNSHALKDFMQHVWPNYLAGHCQAPS